MLVLSCRGSVIRKYVSQTILSDIRSCTNEKVAGPAKEDSDQTRRMSRLIWVFNGRTSNIAGFVLRRLILFQFYIILGHLSCITTKQTKRPARPVKDQPGRPPSLIRVFAVCMKKNKKTSGHLLPIKRTVKALIRTGECSGRSEFSLGAQFCHALAHLIEKKQISIKNCNSPWKLCLSVHLWKSHRQ